MIIPESSKKRVVVIGGGFAGLSFIRTINDRYFQTVLIDQNNYHQFQPLIYQVASSGLEAASICFQLRRLFNNKKDFYFRLAKALSVDSTNKILSTTMGDIRYDYLVICAGATTNFISNDNINSVALPMKNVEEAMYLRNKVIEYFEDSLNLPEDKRKEYSNIVIVGGGSTGVEIAGVLSEVIKYSFHKNYKENISYKPKIHLVSSTVLSSMSSKASNYAIKTLKKMGVNLVLGKHVVDYSDDSVILDDGSSIKSKLLIWVSGIKAVSLEGISHDSISKGGRIMCNEYMEVKNMPYVFSAGDMAVTSEPKYPNGHPQLAQVAIQQARLIATNLNGSAKGKSPKPFRYLNLGSMATIGRNKAVADIGGLHFTGIIAWLMWLMIHLRSILGVKNKIFVLIDWINNYIYFFGSLRSLLFKGKR